MLLERIEAAALGATWLEALVLAILVGTAVRTVWSPGQRWFAGINFSFSAKTLLEIAVLLLGASISAEMIVAAGPLLVALGLLLLLTGLGARVGSVVLTDLLEAVQHLVWPGPGSLWMPRPAWEPGGIGPCWSGRGC